MPLLRHTGEPAVDKTANTNQLAQSSFRRGEARWNFIHAKAISPSVKRVRRPNSYGACMIDTHAHWQKVTAALLFATIAAMHFSSPAIAQGTSGERSACMDDAYKFCGPDIPIVHKIEACLKKNKTQLTQACRAEFSGPTKRTKLRREHFGA
jgi:hypothetical protein